MIKNYLYRDDIDYLRAISVIAVIFFHFELSFTGGFLGVDVFFVISGYLISQILIKQKIKNFKLKEFKNFYIRRILRIVPMLLFICLIIYPICYFLFLPNQLVEFAESVTSTVMMISNFYFWSNSGYFNTASNLKPLLHTWSLSIEEQFYLIFPLFLFVCFKYLKLNKITLLISSISLLSFVLANFSGYVSSEYKPTEFYLNQHNYFSFYWPTGRIWEFGLGYLAFYLKQKKNNKNIYISNLGLFLIFFSFFYFNEKSLTPSIYTLVPTFGTFLFLTYNDKNNVVNLIFKKIHLSFLGQRSYNLYLWHYPLYSIFISHEMIKNNIINKISIIIVLIILSIISYEFIEKKIRYGSEKVRSYSIIIILFLNLLLVAISFVTIKSDGFLDNFYSNLGENKDKVIELYNAFNSSGKTHKSKCQIYINNLSKLDSHIIDNCEKELKKIIIVFGDSHAQDLYNAFAQNLPNELIIGIKFSRNQSYEVNLYDETFFNFLEKNKKNIKYIFYTDAAFFIDKIGLQNTNEMFDKIYSITGIKTDFFGPRNRTNIENITLIKKLSKNYELDAFLIPENEIMWPRNSDKFVINSIHQNFNYHSLMDILKFNITKDFYHNSKFTYSDGTDHWSQYGELYFGKKIINHLKSNRYQFD